MFLEALSLTDLTGYAIGKAKTSIGLEPSRSEEKLVVTGRAALREYEVDASIWLQFAILRSESATDAGRDS